MELTLVLWMEHVKVMMPLSLLQVIWNAPLDVRLVQIAARVFQEVFAGMV